MKIILIAFFISVQMYAIPLGQTLFDGNCVTCHRTDKDESAPSIQKVVDSYKHAYPKKKDFVKNMVVWVYEPDLKSALMPEDIQKHGIMPQLGYDKETLRLIAEYLYEAYQ